MMAAESPPSASIPGGSLSTSSPGRQVMQVYVGSFSNLYEALSIEASKQTTAEEIVECIAEKLGLKESGLYELAEVVGNDGGQDCKERRIGLSEFPVALQLLWPKSSKSTNGRCGSITSVAGTEYRFCLRRKMMQSMNWSFSWTDSNDSQLLKDYFLRFLYQPRDREYPDLCQLPDLTESTLLENLKARFEKGHIYTYVGSILIALNPFKFYPIYNPKYVQLYQNRRLGDLPPHIFAIADAAYQSMLKKRCNQCIVISGESGSGKTESTNFLLHHLTALSQKGSHGSGVEQTILGAGPVLEAFGNAKTKFNNNSSRFGKFIQVNYKENGMVHGAIVQKYLLEKSRIVSHAKNERNYHVFYYMLAGCTQEEKDSLHLTKPSDFFYLNQSKCYSLEGVDEAYELSRLKQSLEMVGFSADKQNRLMSLLAAVLHLGNVDFSKKSAYHNDETVMVKNASVVTIISFLLQVKEEDLLSALTCKRTKAAKGETIVIQYKLSDAIATRDAMAKCLYGALFDWIVMQVNSSLLGKQDVREHRGNYIGVLDIFGFEDFGEQNYFEQFCINFANEHLHFYFNQHVFKYEQEEYKREGINWKNIDFHDNIGCLNLIQGRPHGLLCLLDDQCNFPGASDDTCFQKFVNHHNDNPLFEVPPCKQTAFVIKHYAGKVKYQIRDFREKNMDLMRPDIVGLLKSSSSCFVRELVGLDPLALFRWQILKAFFKAYYIFSKLREESRSRREAEGPTPSKNNNNKTGTNIQMLTRKLGIECISRNGKETDKETNSMTSRVTLRRSAALCVRGNLLRVTSSPGNMHGFSSVIVDKDIDKANKVLMKNKVNRIPSAKKSPGIEKSVKNFKNLRIIAGRSYSIQGPPRAGRKTTQTVTFQFQQSLNQLMETLNQANPFFVRCIKSNADKLPGVFDDNLVLIQLRYTGMLDTVKIRQSGYSVRLSFDEFIQHYRILLPRGLVSSQTDIHDFLIRMNLNRENYQMGNSKIFMRESEKLVLDNLLHREILQRIITLQRWIRTWITRRRFLQMREAAIAIQSHARRWFAQQKFSKMRDLVTCERAATNIQKTWRSFRQRTSFVRLREATINFQAHARGYLFRRDFEKRKEEKRLPKHQRLENERLERLNRSRTPSLPTQSLDSVSQVSEDSTASTTTITFAPSVAPEPLQLVRTRLSSGSVVTSSDVPQSPTLKTFRDSISSAHRSSLSGRDAARISLSSDNSTFVTSSPPPLPPRRTSQNTFNFPSTSRKSLTEQMSAPVGLAKDDTEVKDTGRRPSRPLTRRLSFKNSFSKSPSTSLDKDDVFSSEASRIPTSSSLPTPSNNNASQSFEVTESTAQKSSKGIKTRLKMMITGGGKDKGSKDIDESSFTSRDYQDTFGDYSSSQSRKNSYNTPLSSPASLDAYSGDSLVAPFTLHDVDEYIGNKNDSCFVCQNTVHGKGAFKCSGCQFIFHKKCFGLTADFPCLKPRSGGFGPTSTSKPSTSQRKAGSRKGSARTSGGRSREGSSTTTSSWSVTRTTEFTDPKDVLIGDVSELHYLETFLNKKINLMEDARKFTNKESQVDVVFMSSLKEFKKNLISTYSVASQDPHHMHISYKNLIDHFEQVMSHVCSREKNFKSFPVTMAVNAFRGFLDEFRNLVVKANLPEKTKSKPTKRRRNKLSKKIKEEHIQNFGHVFRPVQANIPTVCEVCSSLMWLMEKVWVCQGCKLTCHKKCCPKVAVSCKMETTTGSKEAPSGCFGIPLERLVDEEHRVPKVVEDLMTAIELKGLYTEGLYRKSGTTSKINEVKTKLDKGEPIDLDSYSIHVLTGVLKSFLREMPDPLMRYEFYDDFLWATTISDAQERVQEIYTHISKLPRAHYDLLERLSFHLARVAQHEHANRMNANSLAIVLAPCVLRTDRPMQMQDKLNDINKLTTCLHAIIGERLKQVCDTLADIDILDNAFRTASSRLSSIRQSKLQLNMEVPHSPTEEEEEERVLKEQLETLRSEKAHLTNMLPTFRLATSGSEEDLLNVDMETSTVGSSLEPESASPTTPKPFTLATQFIDEENILPFSRDPNLRHLTKNRAPRLTNRRLPSRFTADGMTLPVDKNSSKRIKANNSSASHVEEQLFSPEDEPITV